jgi:hypothetical protein
MEPNRTRTTDKCPAIPSPVQGGHLGAALHSQAILLSEASLLHTRHLCDLTSTLYYDTAPSRDQIGASKPTGPGPGQTQAYTFRCSCTQRCMVAGQVTQCQGQSLSCGRQCRRSGLEAAGSPSLDWITAWDLWRATPYTSGPFHAIRCAPCALPSWSVFTKLSRGAASIASGKEACKRVQQQQ